MRKGALPSNTFLERGRGSPPNVDLTIKKCDHNEPSGECFNVGPHNVRGVRPCKAPNDVAGGVSYVRAH